MHLPPFLLLTACLLGACEKRDPAPGATPPDIAATKSSLRDDDHESLGNRRQRSVKDGGQITYRNALEAIDALSRDSAAGQETHGQQEAVRNAIKAADPAQFEEIWKKLSGMDESSSLELELVAIYYPGARQDLAAAVKLAGTLRNLDESPGYRQVILAKLADISKPSVTLALDFLRDMESREDREFLASYMSFENSGAEQLLALKQAGKGLDEWETRVILRWTDPFRGSNDPFAAELPRAEVQSMFDRMMETILSLEKEEVLATGAREMFIIVAGVRHAHLFLENVPPNERVDYLRKEGAEGVIDRIIRSEFGLFFAGESSDLLKPVAKGEIPGYFFTATGTTENLPPERVGAAVAVWQSLDFPAAEAWFATNGPQLPVPQRDEALAGFADHVYFTKDAAEARRWADQITDPGLREKTITLVESRVLHPDLDLNFFK